MKVFISWSEPKSRAVAEVLQGWLRKVLQAVDPFISTQIEKGAQWGSTLANELDASKAGIICLTKENRESRWLHFEAGALSKVVKDGTEEKITAVWTFLVDLTPADVEFPLAQFQHTLATKDDTLELVLSINRRVQIAGEKSLTESEAREVFEFWWPKLESRLEEIGRKYIIDDEQPDEERRTDRDLLEELLEHVRSMRRVEVAPQRSEFGSVEISGHDAQIARFVGVLKSIYRDVEFTLSKRAGITWLEFEGPSIPDDETFDRLAAVSRVKVGTILPF